MEFEERFAPFAARMRAAALPPLLIETFRYYYRQLVEGATGLIGEDEIRPVAELPFSDNLAPSLAEVGHNALTRTILLKLNGGLGTSMGLQKAKSLLVVKDGLNFLDIIARQARHADIPLVLMNSFSTRDDSLAALARYPELQGDIPLDFVQNKVPKIRQDNLGPVEYDADPELTWNPPGHGDIYTALVTSSMLETLLDHGYEYAFVSNADNLGAVMDPLLLGYFVEAKLPFMMEVCRRTAADRKGGHLARRPDGQLVLRESAQTPDEDVAAFQDIDRHRFFNTNSLWLHLPSLQAVLEARNGILGLPLIRNRKSVNPRDPASSPVYQMETAMGSAIAVFDGAGALRVPRSRFAPVKKCDDLLAVRSDAYRLTEDFRIVLASSRRTGPPVVDLDPRYYRLIDDLEARFPYGAPSLRECAALTVRGDFSFGRDVVLEGRVSLLADGDAPQQIDDGTVISG